MNKLLLTVSAMALMLAACGSENMDYLQSSGMEWGKLQSEEKESYVVVGEDRGNYCDATDDMGRKWLLEKRLDSPIGEGRALMFYQQYDGRIEGYDALARLNSMIYYSTGNVVVSPTEAELEAMGNDPITITKAHLAESGQWVDIGFEVQTVNPMGGSHQLSLAVVSEGDDYYCVLCHKGQNVAYGSTLYFGNVSFRLPDEVNPIKRGRQGIRLDYIDITGSPRQHSIYLVP